MTYLQLEKVGINEFNATVVSLISWMRLDEICIIQKINLSENCFRVLEGKTKASKRAIPVHTVLKPLVESFLDSKEEVYLFKGKKWWI